MFTLSPPFWGAEAGDPYWSFVKTLLHFDGNYIDSSTAALPYSASGAATMKMMSNTSITSINGVVFISTIMSSSLDDPTLMDMVVPSQLRAGGSVMKPTLAMPARWQATIRRPMDS